MSTTTPYHDSQLLRYDEVAQGYSEGILRESLGYYMPGGASCKYLKEHRDHRAWRRAVIRECLRRGIISEDPGGAP